ncbi:transcriptional repressor LexA [Petroclostridium sp. X23]|uniref:transcriptional repressor LexA n=1 Tax=Petroclostridium sp. X23 TaxID=3045146 RepID=UPI0024AE6137|nr:transcriptional repressor LexA [Petroclostridium sp. X23]WHH59512.1 transcriptional repressor LexA [Petroclostridium sp. X23]
MQKKLTEKQQMILDFINQQVQQKGYPPSVREICSAVGLKSTSTVHGYLERLEKKGLLQKDASKPRALRLIENETHKSTISNEVMSSREIIEVPILGKVTAGQPILAVENIEDTFPLPVEFAQNSDVFMLRVSGESMINAGILDGDLVVVRKQNTAHNGDIVVALIEDEATVKRFFKEKTHVRLQPENQFMDPILVSEVIILGKVVGVFRKL